jgi:hypothetical protein
MRRTPLVLLIALGYISVHNVHHSALRRMALQNVKRVAWLACQLELKETQQPRDNDTEVNHVSIVGRLRAVGHVSTCCLALVTTGHTVSPILSHSSSQAPLSR